ncbi:CFEM domain-containing protein [Colletotrichum lupini]|uniref:CFEM domain-containing protein n=1 Tax=Colletotrichum lupini TaxID=145971 RepID=A0A9Q8T8E4_9PEZI|nr:CFEM domain-containing protein [Colletotrichum lupini]UQC90798.1 CFEM domain-containing protein [Colletotrichum lupini]
MASQPRCACGAIIVLDAAIAIHENDLFSFNNNARQAKNAPIGVDSHPLLAKAEAPTSPLPALSHLSRSWGIVFAADVMVDTSIVSVDYVDSYNTENPTLPRMQCGIPTIEVSECPIKDHCVLWCEPRRKPLSCTMKASFLPLLLTGLTGLASAASIADAPQCAVSSILRLFHEFLAGLISCALSALPQSPCTISNQTCLCVDPTFNRLVGDCVKDACTIKEALAVTNLTWSSCGFPLTDRTSTARYTTIFLFILPVVFMAIRLSARFMRLAPWGAEDTAICIAFVCVPVQRSKRVQEYRSIGLEVQFDRGI